MGSCATPASKTSPPVDIVWPPPPEVPRVRFIESMSDEYGLRLGSGAATWVDEQDRIYVSDSYGRRVQVFQYLGDRYRELMEREVTEKVAPK